jgi:acyl-coenzyme A thioesterase PaaI-like protein
VVLSPIDPALANAPAGFVHLPMPRFSEFTALAGPWFLKDEGGRLVSGFRVMEHHLNPNRTCHGGMLATFCDVYLAMSAGYAGDHPHMVLPTVSLSLDFLEPTPFGAWVEGRAELLRSGRRMVFIQGLLRVDARVVVRANGTFTIPAGEGADASARRNGLRQLLGVGTP